LAEGETGAFVASTKQACANVIAQTIREKRSARSLELRLEFAALSRDGTLLASLWRRPQKFPTVEIVI
jgi:hypothetical protein